MSRNLLIVPAGEHSLHEHLAADRDFDLWVFYWGSDDDAARRFEKTADLFVRCKGYKWELLRKHANLLYERRSTYADGYIMYLDDDILFENGAKAVSELFAAARFVKADCAQPAIANANISWECTARVAGAACHAVNVVENMMPVIRARLVYDILLPALHALPHIRLAWYMEYFLNRFAEAHYQRPTRSFVFDNIPAEHTRTPGEGSAPLQSGLDEAFLLPSLSACVPTTLAVFNDLSSALEYEFPWAEVDMDDVMRRMSRIRIARRANKLIERLPDRFTGLWWW
jgi:hypothetical protein